MNISLTNLVISILLSVAVGLTLLGELSGLPVIGLFLYIVSLILYSRYPNAFLYAVLAYLFFGNFALNLIGARLPFQSFLDELITYGIWSLFFLNKGLTKKPTKNPWIVKFILLFTGIIIISALINFVSVSVSINFLSTILKPIIIFYIIAESDWNEKQLKSLVFALIGVGIIQGFFVISQTLTGISMGMSSSNMLDRGTGTLGMGLQHHIGYLFLVLLFLTAGIWWKVRGALFFFLSTYLAVTFFLTHTYHALALVPLVFLLLALTMIKKIPSKYLIFIPLCLIVVFTAVVQMLGEERLSKFSSEKLMKSGKVQSYQNLIYKLPAELSYWGMLVGAGPGMYSSEVAIKNQAPLYQKYVYSTIASMERDPQSSTFNFPWTSVIALIGELGPAGLIIYFLILHKLLMELKEIVFSINYPLFWKGVALGGMCGILFIGIMAFILTAFEDMYLTYPVYILAGAIIAYKGLMRQKIGAIK